MSANFFRPLSYHVLFHWRRFSLSYFYLMRKYDKKNNWIKGGRKSNHFYVLRVVLMNNNNNFFSFFVFSFSFLLRQSRNRYEDLKKWASVKYRFEKFVNLWRKRQNRKVEKETLKMQSGTLKRSTLNMATFRFQFL